MGLFNNLMSKIFGHASSVASAGTAAGPAPSGTTMQQGQPSAPAAGTSGGGAAAPAQQVDVAAVLDGLAAKNSEKLDWKHSIVDLMKLVGMDSSFSARKQLAAELHYTGDPNDSASMNVWLHQEVLKKLAANGGKVPQELLK
jgi:Domain of unknown function (DUF3597)